MKFPSCLSLLCLALMMAGLSLRAQTTDDGDSDTEAAPAGSTVITSDELNSDQSAHTSIFDGNVVVIGTNFKMTCQEMKVFFTNDNKVEHIISTGDVVIVQPNRVTHCGHAEYFKADDKFVLTDQPSILQGKDSEEAPEIIIYRGSGKMVTHGHTRVILGSGSLTSPSTNAAPVNPENK